MVGVVVVKVKYSICRLDTLDLENLGFALTCMCILPQNIMNALQHLILHFLHRSANKHHSILIK